MGVGTPEDLVEGVAEGVDMFDCVMPTRNARNGHLFTRFGDLENPQRPPQDRPAPLETCTCHACKNWTAAGARPTCTTWTAAAKCWMPDAHHHPQPALLPEPGPGGACSGSPLTRGSQAAIVGMHTNHSRRPQP